MTEIICTAKVNEATNEIEVLLDSHNHKSSTITLCRGPLLELQFSLLIKVKDIALIEYLYAAVFYNLGYKELNSRLVAY